MTAVRHEWLARRYDSAYYHSAWCIESGQVIMMRPTAIYTPAEGLLRAEQFQVAYATNDIDRARHLFGERLGIHEFKRLEGPTQAGGHIHIELAWVGNTMYELVTARGPGSDVFMMGIPDDVFTIRHHHLGFLIHHDDEWTLLLAEIERNGWRILSQNNNAGFMRTCMVEVAELGHCLEFLFPEPAGIAFLESVPGN